MRLDVFISNFLYSRILFIFRNTLMDVKSFECVITDFGISRSSRDKSRAQVISPRWASPELHINYVPNKKSDVWALGILHYLTILI